MTGLHELRQQLFLIADRAVEVLLDERAFVVVRQLVLVARALFLEDDAADEAVRFVHLLERGLAARRS